MPWKTCQCEQWVERRLYAEAERQVAAEAIAHDRGIGRPRIQEPAVRQQRVFEVAERLRTHHECDHKWRRSHGDGRCGECGNYMKYFLMVRALTGSRIQGRLNFCARNVVNAGTAAVVVALSTDIDCETLHFLTSQGLPIK